MALFTKGQPKTPGSGRKKGTPNKQHSIVRPMLLKITNTDEFWEKYTQELFSLEGREFAHAAKEMFDFLEPKLQAVAVEGNLDSQKSRVMDIVTGLRDKLTDEAQEDKD